MTDQDVNTLARKSQMDALVRDEPDPQAVSFVVTMDMIESCPAKSREASHYRQDGSCRHVIRAGEDT
jgi:hypothetical protein